VYPYRNRVSSTLLRRLIRDASDPMSKVTMLDALFGVFGIGSGVGSGIQSTLQDSIKMLLRLNRMIYSFLNIIYVTPITIGLLCD
jgi:hypothetical protein